MGDDYKINNTFFDLSKVSKKGVQKDDTIKNNSKLNLIFDTLNLNNKDTKLDSKELATFFSYLKKTDADGNKEITDKELEVLAKDLNKPGSDEIKVDDVKSLFSHIMKLTANDEKVSTEEALAEDDKKPVKRGEADKVKEGDTDKVKPDTTETDNDGKTAKVKGDESKVDEEPLNDNKEAETYNYTVQMGESYTAIIKRSLQAKGIAEPTQEQIKEAKDNFEKNNPNSVKRTKKGVEYLLVGTQVKLEGKLEDKNNSAEQISLWVEKYKTVKKPTSNKTSKVSKNSGAAKKSAPNKTSNVSKNSGAAKKSTPDKTSNVSKNSGAAKKSTPDKTSNVSKNSGAAKKNPTREEIDKKAEQLGYKKTKDPRYYSYTNPNNLKVSYYYYNYDLNKFNKVIK